MKLELTRVDGKLSGYKLVAENEEDMKNMGAARDMIFFGFHGNHLQYDGRTTTEDRQFVTSLIWTKRKYHKDYEDKWAEYKKEDEASEAYWAECVKKVKEEAEHGN
jgi:hypothetical protein